MDGKQYLTKTINQSLLGLIDNKTENTYEFANVKYVFSDPRLDPDWAGHGSKTRFGTVLIEFPDGGKKEFSIPVDNLEYFNKESLDDASNKIIPRTNQGWAGILTNEDSVRLVVQVYPIPTFDSPLVQVKNGLEPGAVLCNEGFDLILKSSNNYSACVKPESKAKLIERGWAKPI